MKAYLKSNRKVIVDVEYYTTYPYSGTVYIDKKTDETYDEDELDWVEYYGG